MSEESRDDIETPHGSVPWIYVANVSFLAAGAIFYLYLARVLPVSDLGSVVILSAISSIVATGCSLGLGVGFQHFLSYYRGRSDPTAVRQLVRLALISAVALSVLSGTIVLGFAGQLSQLLFHEPHITYVIRLLSAFAGLATAVTILQSVLIGFQRFVSYSIVSTVGIVVTYTLPLAYLAISKSIDSIVLGWISGTAISVVMAAGAVLRAVRKVNLVKSTSSETLGWGWVYRTMLSYSLPVLASTLIGTGTTYVDRLILASLSSLSAVGVYNYAILAVGSSLIVASPFSTILIPRISALYGRNDLDGIGAVTRLSFTLIVLVYVPIALGAVAIGPFLLRFFVGGGFVSASLPMSLLLVVCAVSIPYVVLVSLASGIRRPDALVKSAALALIANVTLSIVLIPRLGMIGAAIGNSAIYWVTFLAIYFQLRHTRMMSFDHSSIARTWSAGLVMFVTVAVPSYFFNYESAAILPSLIGGVAVLLFALKFFKAVGRDAGRALTQHLPNWARGLAPLVRFVAFE